MYASLTTCLLVVPAVFAGCSQHADPVSAEETPAVVEAQEELADEAPSRPPLDAETVCGQAYACCEAFAAAFPNVAVESACEGPYEAHEAEDADARCERMRLGWREALAHHPSATPPASCGGDAP